MPRGGEQTGKVSPEVSPSSSRTRHGQPGSGVTPGRVADDRPRVGLGLVQDPPQARRNGRHAATGTAERRAPSRSSTSWVGFLYRHTSAAARKRMSLRVTPMSLRRSSDNSFSARRVARASIIPQSERASRAANRLKRKAAQETRAIGRTPSAMAGSTHDRCFMIGADTPFTFWPPARAGVQAAGFAASMRRS